MQGRDQVWGESDVKNRDRRRTRENLVIFTALGALIGAIVGTVAGALGMAMGWGIVIGLSTGAVIDVRRREKMADDEDDTNQASR